MPWAANRAVSFHQKELVMGVCVLDPLRFMIAASKVTLEKGMATTPVFLPGEFRGQRGLVGSTGLQGIHQDYAPKRSTGSPSLSRFPCLPFPPHSHLPFCALKACDDPKNHRCAVLITHCHFGTHASSAMSLVALTQHLLRGLDQSRTQGQAHPQAELRVRPYTARGLSIRVLPT